MSLELLLPDKIAARMNRSWPTEPEVHKRDATELDATITPALLNSYVDTACVPSSEIAVMKSSPSLHPGAYTTNGRTDAVKLAKLYDAGHTIRLGNLQRVIPYLAGVARSIQEETGYSNYVHAFLTPSGNQGLLHHWDQQLAIIAQLCGTKTWELWRPPPEIQDPMREHLESFRVWRDTYIPEWQAAGPDMTINLEPGQSLILPRGWVHNPHNLNGAGESMHLTFAIRERTAFWVAEKMIARAIGDMRFRQVISPSTIGGAALMFDVREVKKLVLEYLDSLDEEGFTEELRIAARTELEYTT